MKLSKKIGIYLAIPFVALALLTTFFIERTSYNVCPVYDGTQIVNNRGWPEPYYTRIEFTECLGLKGDLGREENSAKIIWSNAAIDLAIFTISYILTAIGWTYLSRLKISV